MAAGDDTKPPELTQRQVSEAVNARIRDTAKWLVASYAAIGAALIAGSQLSNLGRLCFGCGRFWAAVSGILLGIGGVAAAIWLTVQVLVAESLALSAIEVEWQKEKSAIHRFFSQDTVFFQGFKSFADYRQREADALAASSQAEENLRKAGQVDKAKAKEALDDANQTLRETYRVGDAIVSLANQIHLGSLFRTRTLPRSLVAVLVAALGVGMFAWAANPPLIRPGASLRNVDLSGSDLRGANLQNLDLSGSNLEGTDLTGADLRGATFARTNLLNVTWSNTLCPDGVNSEQAGGTCENHLGP